MDSATPRRQKARVRRRAASGSASIKARIVRPEKTVSSTTASDAAIGHAVELGREIARLGADQPVAAAAVLLAGEADAADAREPARARVQRRGHALPGRADPERQREGRVVALGHHALDLLAERQDADSIRIAGQQREEIARETRRRESPRPRGAPPRRSDRRGRRGGAGSAAA